MKHDNRPPVFIFHKPQRYFNGTSPCNIGPCYFAKGMDKKLFDSWSYPAYFNRLLDSDRELHAIVSGLNKGVYIFGHTHIPLCWEQEGRLLVNPGSCGLPLDFNRKASYGILEWTGNSYKASIRRVAYDADAVLSYTRKSDYAKEIGVWSGVIAKELETARAQAVPFLDFADQYASGIQDMVRPFSAETWYAAYEAWCNL